MQYFYRDIHEPLIHCFIKFEGRIDEGILKKAVTLSLDEIPIIKCTFNNSSLCPYWEIKQFGGNDIVRVEDGKKSAVELLESLASRIDIFRGPQLRILLARYEDGSDAICAAINHMVCDGAGFKEYLYLLAGLYTQLEKDINYTPHLGMASRSISLVYKNKGFFKRISLLFSKLELPRQNFKSYLPIKGAARPFFAAREIKKEDFAAIKKYAKRKNATVNDVFLTAYARLLAKELNLDEVVVPCPADMRKYLPAGQKLGICNLTLNYYCKIKFSSEDSFSDALLQVCAQIKEQKENDNFLKPLFLLENASRILRFKALHKHFKKVFDIPVISYSNLGIIDEDSICFGGARAAQAFLTGAVKHHPYFQISVSGFDGTCTITSNMYAASCDKIVIEKYLGQMVDDLLSASGQNPPDKERYASVTSCRIYKSAL